MVDVPSEDAAPLTDKPGERAVILFDAKDWHHGGNTWTIQNARIAYVEPPDR